jgi:hypothetical protein
MFIYFYFSCIIYLSRILPSYWFRKLQSRRRHLPELQRAFYYSVAEPFDPRRYSFRFLNSWRRLNIDFQVLLQRWKVNASFESTLCHTMSPQRMIPPPNKRSRILVNVKSAAPKRMAATCVAARILPENPASRLPPSRAKSGLCEAGPSFSDRGCLHHRSVSLNPTASYRSSTL